jgi:RNA polymerase sigma-70 factor (ECF subfamily)
MTRLEEKILFSKIRQKDKEAFAKVYDLHIDEIYRFIFFKVSNTEEAEDLTSAVFLKTWNYLQKDNQDENYDSLRPLLYKIARNTVIDHYRKTSLKERTNIALDSKISPVDIVDEKQDIVKQAEISSDLKIVQEKINELKEEYREIILMRFVQELSFKEIALILNKSRGNARVLAFRALKALRELVNEDT